MLVWWVGMWKMVSIEVLTHKAVVAVLEHVGGFQVQVASVHMHHDALERAR